MTNKNYTLSSKGATACTNLGACYIGVDVGSDFAVAAVTGSGKVHRIVSGHGWHIGRVVGVVTQMRSEFLARPTPMQERRTFAVAVEVAPRSTFGKFGGAGTALYCGELVGRMNDLADMLEWSGFVVSRLSPRFIPGLKVKADIFAKYHPETAGWRTNEHERDAVAIAVAGISHAALAVAKKKAGL